MKRDSANFLNEQQAQVFVLWLRESLKLNGSLSTLVDCGSAAHQSNSHGPQTSRESFVFPHPNRECVNLLCLVSSKTIPRINIKIDILEQGSRFMNCKESESEAINENEHFRRCSLVHKKAGETKRAIIKASLKSK
jgi:hypothetical protein